MKSLRFSFAGSLCAIFLSAVPAAALERAAPPHLASAPGNGLTEPEREAVVSWALAQPEVRAIVAHHRVRVLRVWSDVAKGDDSSRRRAAFVLRDYDSGNAREVTVDLPAGRIQTRELSGVQPSRAEIDEGMEIVRRDPALAAFASNPDLVLVGGFHNRSPYADDPCAREMCLELAFMKPNYGGPARYVVVNLTRRIVAHHDFRMRAGEGRPRMTEKAGR
jgi:hypothetical protein